MGRLRLEPRDKILLTEDEYKHYCRMLREAHGAAHGHYVYWDLENDEDPGLVRRRLLHVAHHEGISVGIRKARGNHSLTLSFKSPPKTMNPRISASECKKRIIGALTGAEKPLQKSEIIRFTGISPSTWNLRIRELVASGEVRRTGDRRDTRYSLTG